ncbi:MAG: dUTP diphosphatase [Patescibacteria group bacterium]
MIIKFKKLFKDAKSPIRATAGAVGLDVHAYHVVDKTTRERVAELPAEIQPGKSLLIGTGIVFAVPFPVDCQVRPRSGLANKYDVELSNSPGTVDPDYRGEIGILLRNRGDAPFRVKPGMRIAQLVFVQAEIPVFVEESAELPPTRRGRGGFGSTGYDSVGLGDGDYLLEQAKWDAHFMRMAVSASLLSNCVRGATKGPDGRYVRDGQGRYAGACRRFGCVIVQDRNVVAQGFNMRADGCTEEGCIREQLSIPSGTSLERGCLHAEQVALQNHALTGGPSLKGATAYVNAEPCLMCAKSLSGSGISTVVVPSGVYPTNGLKYLLDSNVEVRHVPIEA